MEKDDKEEEKAYGEVQLLNVGSICTTLMLAEAFHQGSLTLVLIIGLLEQMS